jgi:hypothetical protein
MRILARDRALFIGRHRCPEFDCPQGPPPENLGILLCLVDGAERRRHLQDKLNASHPQPGPELGDPNVPQAAKR